MSVSPIFIAILQKNNLWESLVNLGKLFQNGLISKSDLLSKMVQIMTQNELCPNQKSQILAKINKKSESKNTKLQKNLEEENSLNPKNPKDLEFEKIDTFQKTHKKNLDNFDSDNSQKQKSDSTDSTDLSTNLAFFSHSNFQFLDSTNQNSQTEKNSPNLEQNKKSSQKNLQKTLIIGNGDVMNLFEARAKVIEFGVDGVMIGRGILSNPYLFAEIEMSSKSPTDRLHLLILHLDLWQKTWQMSKNFGVLKKYFKIYIQGFLGASQMRAELMETTNPDEARAITQKWLKNYK